MTSLERLLASMAGGEPDRVPVSPHGWGLVNPDSAMGAEMLARLDLCLPVGCGAGVLFGQGAEVSWTDYGSEVVTTWALGSHELRQVTTRTNLATAVTTHFCSSAADLATVLEAPFAAVAPNLDEYRGWCARVSQEALILVGVGTGLCAVAELLSPEDLCLLWADAPELLRAAVDAFHRRAMELVERCCHLGARAFRIIGGEYASTQLGPAGFAALCVEQDRELCNLMRSHGAVSYYHNHGPVKRFLDLFAAIGMDALDPLEAPPYGDADLRECRQALGSTCLVGNLDDMEQLEQWPAARLRDEAACRLEAAGPCAFVLGGTASGTYTEAGARGFLALLDVVG